MGSQIQGFRLMGKLSAIQQADLIIKAFGFRKIPLIYYSGVRVVDLNDERLEIMIPLNKRTQNHLNSMYFGALAIGADVAGGLLAFLHMQQSEQKMSVVFKDLHADFLKRAEGDVHFISIQNKEIKEMISRIGNSGERENMEVDVVATVPSVSEEPVARFKLTLSAKMAKG